MPQPLSTSIRAASPDAVRVLLVEDEASIAEPFAQALARNGFETVIARTASDALRLGAELEPDVVLLDITLPDGDGRDVCRELRGSSNVPIIMLTARGTVTDRIVGLELGADDYVVKPFAAEEVISRIRAVLRRARSAPPEPASMVVGELQLDVAARRALLAALAYVLLLAIVALGVPLASSLSARVNDEVRSQALGQADLVAATAADLLAGAHRKELAALTRTAAADVRGRVLILDKAGVVLADSAGPAQLGVGYATAARPEIKSALAGNQVQSQRASRTLGEEILATAVPITPARVPVG